MGDTGNEAGPAFGCGTRATINDECGIGWRRWGPAAAILRLVRL